MEFEFLADQEACRISLEKKDGRLVFRVGEATFEADARFVLQPKNLVNRVQVKRPKAE